MKTKNSHIYILMALALLALGSLAHCANITWINTSGGKWSVATNWSPNQVPGTNDSALITQPGTYTVVFDINVSGYASYVTTVTNLTVGAGGAGTQTLLITNLTPQTIFTVKQQLLVTNNGVIVMAAGFFNANSARIDGGLFNGQGSGFQAPLTVTDGGVINDVGGAFAAVTVTNGGVVNVNAGSIGGGINIAKGGLLSAKGLTLAEYSPLIVAPGGVLDLLDSSDAAYGDSILCYSVIQNAGIINMTNGVIHFINNDYQGGGGSLLNLPGGVINLHGNGSIILGTGLLGYEQGYHGYVTNQGTITQITGTNTIYCPFYDNSQGTITNLSGVLSLGLFQTNLAGTYFTAAGATIQFVGADLANDNSAPQLTLSTPLVLGGSGQYQLMSGYLYLPANLPTNLELLGDTVELGPNFQGGAITNLTLVGMELLNTLPVTGTLTVTNLQIDTNLLITSSGVFSVSDSIQYGPSINAVAVSHGGTMNVTGPISLRFPITNAGTLNLNESLVTFDVYSPSPAGIVNQPGGLINMIGAGGISASSSADYFINQGSIVQNAGAGATDSISYQAFTLFNNGEYNTGLYPYQPFQFDNSQGTITNLSGTLVLPSFQSTLAGTFYAAAGATIQLGGGTTNAPLVAGTPLVLGGSGQYQFISGYLYLAANTILNLSLQGGELEIGPGFQGGSITNLTLNGITFTNTAPITGKLTLQNTGESDSLNATLNYGYYGNGFYGNIVVSGTGVLTASNSVIAGSLLVTNGGMFQGLSGGNGVLLIGTVVIANGGVFNAGGSSCNGAVTVASGGVFNSPDTFFSYLGVEYTLPGSYINGPLTNFGTINVTNSGIEMYNDGTTKYTGSLINQAGGLIEFFGNGGIANYGGSGGHEYIVNQGTIIKSAGTNISWLDIPFTTNSGAIIAKSGVIGMGYYGPASLQPGSSLNVVLYNATNYTKILFEGPAPLGGALNVTLANGYVPTNGTTFNVLTYGSFTGSFSSLGLPAAVSWQSKYGSTNFSLVAGSGSPQFGSFNLSGTNLIFNGTGGPAGSNYVVLVSTNLALPLANWSALTTNTFDGSGQFHYTNNVNPAKPRQFFIFKLP